MPTIEIKFEDTQSALLIEIFNGHNGRTKLKISRSRPENDVIIPGLELNIGEDPLSVVKKLEHALGGLVIAP